MFVKKEEYLSQVNRENIVALIPARSGSKGIYQKNIQMISGYPLIAYSIVAGLLSKKIDRVIVSTDSVEIAEIAKQYGAEVPFLRPAEFASDKSGDIEFVEHAIHYMYTNEECIPEYLVHLRPTTPLRDIAVIDEAIMQCMKNTECCSLRSAHKASESPFKWFLKQENGYFRSIQEGVSNDDANGARQLFADVYIPDGYVDVIKSSYVIQQEILHGEQMLAFESPFCVEVDTIDDLDYIQYQVEKRGSVLLEYLKRKF